MTTRIPHGDTTPFLSPRTKVFNFRRHWRRVRPLLQDPEIQFVLDDNLAAHATIRRNNYRTLYAPPGSEVRHLFPFKHGDCPLRLARGDYWGAMGRRTVKKGSVDWYRVWGACHALAWWVLEIGERLYPSLHWSIRRNDEHSTVIGCFADGEIRWFMDILLFEEASAEELFLLTLSPHTVDRARSVASQRPRARRRTESVTNTEE